MALIKKRKKNNARKKIVKKKNCAMCEDKTAVLHYKEVERLKSYTSEKGKIIPRKISGLCARHQRDLARVIKRARHAGLLEFAVTA